MKTKKISLTVSYKFQVAYEHKEHLAQIVNDLKKAPIFKRQGAGIVDGKAYSYSCKMVGDVVV